MTGSDWLVELAIEPAPGAWDSVREALDVASRHLGLQLRGDADTGQMVLGARSEGDLRAASLYLQAAVPDRYRLGHAQVGYRTTPAGPAEATYAHRKQRGGTGEFAEVILRLVPGARGSGFRFVNADLNGNVLPEWLPSVEVGVRDAGETDPMFPLIDFEAHLIDGKYHDLDSSPAAFERAAAGAMRLAAANAGIILLEPIVKLAVLTPGRWTAQLVAELERRNVSIEEMRPGETSLIAGNARMLEMLGFEDALNAMTNGSASAAFVLHAYAEVPEFGGPDDSHPMAAALRA